MTSTIHCPTFALTGTCRNKGLCQLPHISPNIIYALKSAERRSQSLKTGDEDIQGGHETPEETLAHSFAALSVAEEMPSHPPPKSPIESFFDKYPAFDYDASKPIMHEFNRLCDAKGWNKHNTGSNKSKAMLNKALVNQFNLLYGTDEENIESWRILCRVLNIRPIPNSLDGCRQAVKSIYFNLVDMVDCRVGNVNHRVRTFPTKAKLKGYSMSTGKVFPPKSGNAGGLLKYLLLDNVVTQVAETKTSPLPQARLSGSGPPYDNSISSSSMNRENLAYLWIRSYDS